MSLRITVRFVLSITNNHELPNKQQIPPPAKDHATNGTYSEKVRVKTMEVNTHTQYIGSPSEVALAPVLTGLSWDAAKRRFKCDLTRR